MFYYSIILIVFQSYSSFCVRMTFSKEEAVKGLKDVTKMLEEGGEADSSALCLIEEFLKKFPPGTVCEREVLPPLGGSSA